MDLRGNSNKQWPGAIKILYALPFNELAFILSKKIDTFR